MNAANRKLEFLVWGTLVLTILGIAAAFTISRYQAKTRVVLGDLPIVTSGLPAFTLTNQLGVPVTAASLTGNVVIADVVFTRCGGPCPQMTRKMAELQSAIPPQAPIRFLTFTTDPGYDTPAVLKKYGEKFGADFNRWSFLTGQNSEFAIVMREGLKLFTEEVKPQERLTPEDLFVHSTLFVILDKHGRLRGAFDKDDSDFIAKVKMATRQLAKEP
ncbi:MAG TPA: SCO family protein [Verrucomicrobiae bacterium]